MRSPPLPPGVDDALALLLSETDDERLIEAVRLVRRALHERFEVERRLRQELAAAKRNAAEQSSAMRAELVDLRTALVTNLATLRSDVARDEQRRDDAMEEEAPPPPPPPLPESGGEVSWQCAAASDARALRSPRGSPPGVAALAVAAAAAAKEEMVPVLASALMNRAVALEASISRARAAAEEPLQPSTLTGAYGRRVSLPQERRERQLRWRMEWEGLGFPTAETNDSSGAPRARAAPTPKAEGSVPVSTASRLVGVSDDSSSEPDSTEEEEEEERRPAHANAQRTFAAHATRAFPSARDIAAAAAMSAIEAATVAAAAALEGDAESTSDDEISSEESSTATSTTSSDSDPPPFPAEAKRGEATEHAFSVATVRSSDDDDVDTMATTIDFDHSRSRVATISSSGGESADESAEEMEDDSGDSDSLEDADDFVFADDSPLSKPPLKIPAPSPRAVPPPLPRGSPPPRSPRPPTTRPPPLARLTPPAKPAWLGECSLCTVTFHANLAHSLTRSPSHL